MLAIPGVTVPVRGATPVTTAIDTAQYTGTIAWSPAVASTFSTTTVYTANIVLTAKAGWTLTGVGADGFTVAGATATNAVDTGTVAAVFPATLSFSLTMVTVPAGSFQRDATATNISNITTAYRMSEEEITMEQFVSVTGLVNPSMDFTAVVNGPVQCTNWYHALVFCNKLSIAEGLMPVYTIRSSTVPDAWDGTTDGTITVPTATDSDWDAAICNWSASGYRLPTEMEWMWAAMGATSGSGYTGPTHLTGYGKLFAGSDSTLADGSGGTRVIGDYAWYSIAGDGTGLNSIGTTHPVGTTGGASAKANELGLYDMSGNVWELCWDWYDTYPTGTASIRTSSTTLSVSGLSAPES